MKNNINTLIKKHEEMFAFDHLNSQTDRPSMEGLVSDVFSFIFGKKKPKTDTKPIEAKEQKPSHDQFLKVIDTNNKTLKSEFQVKDSASIPKEYASSFTDSEGRVNDNLNSALKAIDNRLNQIKSLTDKLKIKIKPFNQAMKAFIKDYEKLDYQKCTYEDLKAVIKRYINNKNFQLDLTSDSISQIDHWKVQPKTLPQFTVQDNQVNLAIQIYLKYVSLPDKIWDIIEDDLSLGIDLSDPPFRGFIDEIDEDREITQFLNSIYADEVYDKVDSIFYKMEKQVDYDLHSLMYLVLKSIQ